MPGADAALTKIAQDVSRPAIIRATALDRMSATPGNNAIVAITRAVKESDPLMRQAAISATAPYPVEDRWRMLKDLLNDKHLPIRAEAARSVAQLLIADPSPLNASEKKQLQAVLEEYRKVQHYQADRSFAHGNLGNLAYDLGDKKSAEKHYRAAIEAEPIFMPPKVNLAELYRQEKDESQANNILEKALTVNPEANPINYALGMSLIRQGKKQQALDYLEKAATLGEPNADTIYAHALLLQDLGKSNEAIDQLLIVYSHTPSNPDISYSLSQAYLAENDFINALTYARKLAELVPGNPQMEAMVEQIERIKNAHQLP